MFIYLFKPHIIYNREIPNEANVLTIREVNKNKRIYASGRVEGKTPEIKLSSLIIERVTQIQVSEGDIVKKGDVLIQLDTIKYKHEVDLAEAELQYSIANLNRLTNGATQKEIDEAEALYKAKLAELSGAKSNLERITKLKVRFTVTEQEYDSAVWLTNSLKYEAIALKARYELLKSPTRSDDIDIAKTEVDKARVSLNLKKFQLEQCQIKAPSEGKILNILIEPGELIGPQQVLITMVDTKEIFIKGYVEEQDAFSIHEGMEAIIKADGIDKIYKGKIIKLSSYMGKKQLWTDEPDERHDVKMREIYIQPYQSDSLIIGLPVDIYIEP